MNPNNMGQPYQPNTPGVPPQQPQPVQANAFQQPQPFAQPVQVQQPQPQSPFAPQPASFSSGRPSKLWQVLTVVFVITTIIGIGGGVWAFMNYMDQKNNVDSKVSAAVTEAVKVQADEDAAEYLEKEKQPNRQFAGPDDYGQLSFDYPKTWSVYVSEDATSGGMYEAYLNPAVVPPVSSDERYALRVTIEEKDYDKVLETYNGLVTKGELKSSVYTINEQNSGTRLDGSFTKDIRGSAVVFKIRDKTVTLRTDADTFQADFDALVKTVTFNM